MNLTMDLLNRRIFWLLSFAIMSAYIAYEHSTNCVAIDLATMIQRHERFMAGESEFFNPWQYRILAPFMLEGIIRILDSVAPGLPEVFPLLVLKFVQSFLLLYVAFI